MRKIGSYYNSQRDKWRENDEHELELGMYINQISRSKNLSSDEWSTLVNLNRIVNLTTLNKIYAIQATISSHSHFPLSKSTKCLLQIGNC